MILSRGEIANSLYFFRALFPVIISLLVSADCACAPLNKIRFKATHNSYHCDHLPSTQIANYNVWEIELDFGIAEKDGRFIVGHNGPEPRGDLYYLRDWIFDIKKATERLSHPVIIKLEAKTKNRSGPFRSFKWKKVKKWGNWQHRLRDSLQIWLGRENIVGRDDFENTYNNEWPDVSYLKCKYIISLQDNNNDKDIDANDSLFFIREIGGLKSPPKPVHSVDDYCAAVMDGVNRLIMDNQYQEEWSDAVCISGLSANSGAKSKSRKIVFILIDNRNARSAGQLAMKFSDEYGNSEKLTPQFKLFKDKLLVSKEMESGLRKPASRICIELDSDDDIGIARVIVISGSENIYEIDSRCWVGRDHQIERCFETN